MGFSSSPFLPGLLGEEKALPQDLGSRPGLGLSAQSPRDSVWSARDTSPGLASLVQMPGPLLTEGAELSFRLLDVLSVNTKVPFDKRTGVERLSLGPSQKRRCERFHL